MKTIMQFFIAIIIMLLSNNVKAQNLTLSQILEIKKKNLGNAEEYLTSKGWEFLDAIEPTEGRLGQASFTYNKSESSDLAESFFTYFYSEFTGKTRILFQVNNKIKYNEYINTIKSYGCKLINSKIEDGNIIKIYRGATTTFEVTSDTSENIYHQQSANWFILIVSNEDYDLVFVED